MQRRVLSREFKLEAIKLIKEHGVAVAQAARDLGVAESVLRRWTREREMDTRQAFPGHGHVKPEQQEVAQMRRKVAKRRAERDILKDRGLLCQGADMKFDLVAKHRGVWPMRCLREALGVSPSGFHPWLSRSPSARAVADEARTARVRASFVASDRIYCARRVWHDVLAGGPSRGLHQVERLMLKKALRARPRGRRFPADRGERCRAAIAANVLDRQFEASAPNQKWVANFTYIWTADGWLYVAPVIDLFHGGSWAGR